MKRIIERGIVCPMCKGKGVKATGWDYFVSIFTFGLPFMVGLNDCPRCCGTGEMILRETVFERAPEEV